MIANYVLDNSTWEPIWGPVYEEAPPPPPPPPTGGVYPITLDLSTAVDNTASLTAQLASFPDGTATAPTRITFPAGRYRIDGEIQFDNRRHLEVTATGFELWTPTPGELVYPYQASGEPYVRSVRKALDFTNSSDILWVGGTLNGTHESSRYPSDPRFGNYTVQYSGEPGISVGTNCQRIEITDLVLLNFGGDCITVGINDGIRPTDITFRRITGGWSGRQTIAVTSAERVLFADCDLQWGGRTGVDIEPINRSYQAVRDITFLRCVIGSRLNPYAVTGIFGVEGFKPGYGVWEDGTTITNRRKNITFVGCTALNSLSSQTGILASRSGENLTVTGHRDTRQRSTVGMDLNGWDTVTIDDVEISSGPSTPTSYGAALAGCGTVSITNSDFNGTGGSADELYQLTAGSGDILTATATGLTDSVSASRHQLQTGNMLEVLSVTSGAPLPTGTYWAVNVVKPTSVSSVGTFQIATSQGGSPMNLNDGTFTYRLYFPPTTTPTHHGNTWAEGTASD